MPVLGRGSFRSSAERVRRLAETAGEHCSTSGFHGLIQHSFALRLDEEHAPFRGHDTRVKVEERFLLSAIEGAGGFRVKPVGELADEARTSGLAPHSPLVRRGLTTVERQGIAYLERDSDGGYRDQLPDAFSWASGAEKAKQEPWEKFIFARREEGRRLSLNDFLIEAVTNDSGENSARDISRWLSQLLAHRRSRLFGIALADHFVNVMLPHAILTPTRHEEGRQSRGARCAAGSWLLQPLVSLIRVGRDGGDFRGMYSLTLFLIPVSGRSCEARKMARREIEGIVNAGWGLASSPWPPKLSLFEVSGPLPSYVAGLDRRTPSLLSAAEAGSAGTVRAPGIGRLFSLRQAAEAIMFAVALRMAQGSTRRAGMRVMRRIGDDVVTSLANSRVSSVVVVDEQFAEHTDPPQGEAFPGVLGPLMDTLSEEARIAPAESAAKRLKYRLDRPFFDDDSYAIGVLPSSSCLVVTVDPKAQRGRWESGLMQAGWIAYMAIGAATAIGTIRGIHRQLERAKRSDPSEIADIEHEVVVDLYEIYDLDITWDAYRYRYRRLRDQLGITSDYEALQEKLQAFYRETTACFEAKAQARLTMLTAAIVVLSVLILAGTIVLALK